MPKKSNQANDKPTTIADITDMSLSDAAELFERSRGKYSNLSIRVNDGRFTLVGCKTLEPSPSCLRCVARRTNPKGIVTDGEYHLEFLCARRGWIIEVMGPCQDFASELSLSPSIVEGGNPIIVNPATAVDALRRGKAVAIDDVWYRITQGRLCTLSPRGDNPRMAREAWTPAKLDGHVCIVIDHGEADE